MFYIYEWFNVDTNEVFYVGKGVYNRYKVKKRNKKFNEYLENNNCDVRIIERYENELMCFKREEELIEEYKNKGQCQCNLIFGGNGGVKNYWTKELKEKMSKENPMKSKEQRKRMSINNPMKNPEIAKKVGLTQRKRYSINNKTFIGLTEIAEYYNITYSLAHYWAKRGATNLGEKIEIIENKKPIYDVKKDKCYILFRNKKFNSIRELSEKENIPYKTIENWLKKGFSSKGEYIRYSNDEKEYVYIKPNKTHTNKPIIVNGKFYNSILDASKELNISWLTLKSYLEKKGNRNLKKYKNLICEYANQHPSHTNSDKSSVEGSTTNE